MNSTRRIFFYLVTFVALGVLTGGIGQLLALIFKVIFQDTSTTQVGREVFNIQQFSLGLAMIVIAGPLWFFSWRSIQKRVTNNPEEIGSTIRKLFLNLVLLISVFTATGTASAFLRWLLDGAKPMYFPSGELATLIVIIAVWFYHWQVSEKEDHPSSTAKTLRRWYIYITSSVGLIWFSVSIVRLISGFSIFLPFWGNIIARGEIWSNATQSGVIGILIGGILWYFHWFRMSRGDIESVLRQVYFYVVAISGGVIATLVALTITIYQSLKWAMGAVTVSGGEHFQFLGWTLPAAIVGIAIWGYHRQSVREERAHMEEQRLSAQRIHLYLMSFLGLGTLVTGLIYLFGILLGLIIGSAGTSIAGNPNAWKNALSICLALLLVGTPIWLYYWRKVLKLSETGGVVEWRARSRRIFLYTVAGVAIGTLIADLVNIVYQLLNGLLQHTIDSQFLRNIRWSLETLVVAGPLLWYHWRIIRTDQQRGGERPVIHKSVTLIIDDRMRETAVNISEQLGYKIKVLYTSMSVDKNVTLISQEEVLQAINNIQNATSRKLLLVALDGKLTVLPYHEK